MKCEDVRNAIQEHLDGGPLSEAAREHTAACGECAAFRERLTEVDRMLAADPVLAWTPNMTASVVAGVRSERRTRLFLGAAAAAVVLIAAWLAVGLVPEIPGIGSIGERVAERVDLPATPAEAATRVAGSVGAFFGAAFRSIPLGAGAPVALLALALFLTVNAVVAGRLRLAGRST